ncbi:MAG TPA: ATPase, T2SS/T4P/T4SS family [Candidatus Saccharimonadales bacterium]|nr:ATPase, T2SS/T4P/T4SS family [Candidatus Saccharimonadales bacterium]
MRKDKQVAETLAMLVAMGVKRGASDIHIEPHERFVLVRYRIDGSLRGIHKLPRDSLSGVMAQLKTLADLNVNETRAPQEGTYVADAEGGHVTVRVATMPVFGGEKAVLHLSIRRGAPPALADLGFWGKGLQTLQHVLTSPAGLVLVAGPRHGGTATTLFSMVHALNSPLVSIATVETQRKHRLPGVNQTYLGDSSAMTMSTGLRAALKQDPNIIMLGDVPDSDTAAQAVHAATSGHLLLSGMHADNSVRAVLRVRAAGIEPFLLITCLRASVGQRLVRTLCPDCRERYALSRDEQRELAESFGITGANAYKRIYELESQAAPAIFGDVKQLNSTPTSITHLWRPSEAGCDTCDRSSYVGRTAITEVLENTSALHKLLMDRDMHAVPTIQTAAIKEGFIPMGLDGLIKALRGQTTITEVLRAVHTVA